MALAHADRTRRVFSSVIGNALKYSGKDKVPVVDIVGVTADNTGSKMVEVHVKDNGIGFDDKYLERILSPFGRLVTQDEYPGSGLGLTTAKQILDDAGGTITVKSKEGEGATFIVALPSG